MASVSDVTALYLTPIWNDAASLAAIQAADETTAR